MTGYLEVISAGPGISVQDLGRPGFTALGLSTGGAADRRALWEAAALLGQARPQAALELPLTGGRFRVTAPTRLALTGAPMQASRDGKPLIWNASHGLAPGELLDLRPGDSGVYGYLSLAGGLLTVETLGARATLAAAGLGTVVETGMRLPFGTDPAPATPPQRLPADDRFGGGALRVIEGPQTALFDAETRARAFATAFQAGPASRQGLALTHKGAPFGTATAGLLSDFIGPGDIQMTGAGQPVVLLADCQTIGGYPRLGTVIPTDLSRAAQARPGTALRLVPIPLDAAEIAAPPEPLWLAQIRRQLRPLTRDPRDIADLLSYQLISGMIRGDEEDA
ncbi:urea amidolyase [Rhodobacter capsulatus]|uniref:Urea amidolyase n=1 Tax=Rhodobacter capsulatus TaxID=1061 RepID=A0A4U1JW89_RHOCA|nr:biotin-dependent carboxyltransferase family protein [Rhodobacter capsulatus]TKD23039.1 urea amidolyase [Rhodobacter capsulatus]